MNWATDRLMSTGVCAWPRGRLPTAISFTLTDDRPPGWLIAAADKGKLDTPEGVATAIEQLLADSKTPKPRIMRFFREYFGYDRAIEVFKEPRRLFRTPQRRRRHGSVDSIHLGTRSRRAQRIADDEQIVCCLQVRGRVEKKPRADLAKFEAEKAKDPKKFATKKPNLPGKAVYESYNLAGLSRSATGRTAVGATRGILTQPLVACGVVHGR